MQSDETSLLRAKIVKARSKLLAAVEGLEPEVWEWEPGDGQWSARLTLAHVGSAHWSHLEVAQRLVAGEEVSIPDFELDAWNAAHVAERAAWTVEEIMADLEAAQQETLSFLDRLDSASLAITGEHPALGEVSVGQVLGVIALHDTMHRRDIVKLLRQQKL